MTNQKTLKHPLSRFAMRWAVSSLGLWLAALLLSGSISYGSNPLVLVVAGLVLAVINTVLKPILIIFSLPAILFSLGLFMIVINGLTVYLASKLYNPLEISSFWAAVFAGLVIGLVNYLITAILEEIRE